MMARITNSGAIYEAFVVTSGVKQGCVLIPTAFSLMFSAMLLDANGHQQRLQDGRSTPQSSVNGLPTATIIRGRRIADDRALNAATQEDIPRTMCIVSTPCKNFDLTTNTENTVVVHQPPQHRLQYILHQRQ
ncbi:unnamed protein product [Schistocephalus solidus]|uniref:Reverse transcriptase domain-containing protein n=1 Tax=Schistocephalus solidus TaxID=70667 RepID=A0A183TLC8_SCHSO|nr:unnamed protein product [Schistocephalus solidus]